MAYIGNQPALAYTSFSKQDFTTSATDTYTLDFPVANENEIALFINFVRQEPTTAYTASGTTLTLASAITGSDDMYCVFLGKAVQTVNPPSGSVGSSQISSNLITGQTAESSADNNDSLLIYDDTATALRKMTRGNFLTGVGGANTPILSLYKGSDQTLTNATVTKITFGTVNIDTNSAWSSNTFTVPSGQDGKYMVLFGFQSYNSANTLTNSSGRIYKNGSLYEAQAGEITDGSSYMQHIFTQGIKIIDLVATDTIEFYGYINRVSGSAIASQESYASIIKLIE